jgi:photosystem II stability/assembly factor-like uncharacterized protein
VYKSTDNGRTWAHKINGMGDNTFSHHIVLASDGTLYQTVMRTHTDGAAYQSTDGGDSWAKLNLPERVTFPNKIAADPHDPKRLYLTAWPSDAEGTGGGVYRSLDGGATWTCVFDERVRVFGVAADPKRPGHVYIVTFEHSAHRSMDGGDTWERIRGYRFKWGQNPVIDPHDDEKLYITTFGGGIFHGPKAGGDGYADDIDGFML